MQLFTIHTETYDGPIFYKNYERRGNAENAFKAQSETLKNECRDGCVTMSEFMGGPIKEFVYQDGVITENTFCPDCFEPLDIDGDCLKCMKEKVKNG